MEHLVNKQMGVCSSGCSFRMAVSKRGSTNGQSQMLSTNDKIRYENILCFYELGELLGQGHFGIVRSATRIYTNQKQKYAVKSIPIQKVQDKIKYFKNEITIIQSADHPNIIKFYESFEDEQYIHIVMEQCRGKDLLSSLLNNGKYSEKTTAGLMRTMLRTIGYLHSIHICHRDLKPDNFIFTSDEPGAQLKLIDFGLAKKFGEDAIHTVVGTPYYVAPEVLKKRYSQQCDVWSLGVIMYILLCGHPPFKGRTHKTIFKRILGVEYDFEDEIWESISSEAKDLIRRMLVYNPYERITIENALQHPWFDIFKNEEQVCPPLKILSRLKNFQAPKMLQEIALKVILKNLNEEEIVQMSNVFQTLDVHNKGYIKMQQLNNVLQSSNFQVSQADFRKIQRTIDIFGNGKLKYSDFMMATLKIHSLMTEDRVFEAFKMFDLDNSGVISMKQIHFALQRAGFNVNRQQVSQMLQECNIKEGQKLNFNEFKSLISGWQEIEARSPLYVVRDDGSLEKYSTSKTLN